LKYALSSLGRKSEEAGDFCRAIRFQKELIFVAKLEVSGSVYRGRENPARFRAFLEKQIWYRMQELRGMMAAMSE
jgi:hypothetical protein